MAFPSVTNLTGVNPGPNDAVLPDTVQLPVGNIWKIGSFALTLSPSSVANVTVAEQTFTMTGLLTTDLVVVQNPSPQAGLGIAGSRCSAAGVLAISFVNPTSATITPTSSVAYEVAVLRVQPNWTAPTSGSLIDW
jgi:hypothetical protein